jgi:hypothetical protein
MSAFIHMVAFRQELHGELSVRVVMVFDGDKRPDAQVMADTISSVNKVAEFKVETFVFVAQAREVLPVSNYYKMRYEYLLDRQRRIGKG